MGILGNYGESQWALANFTVPPECACVCAFGVRNSVIGKSLAHITLLSTLFHVYFTVNYIS